MLQQDAINKMDKNSTKKLDYRSPALVCYGRVRNLTQSGTALIKESNCGNGNTQDKNKPCTGSDPRAKANIVRIGTHPLGISLYLFDYKPEFQEQWGYGRQFGVMSDEVEAVMPEAVCENADGYKMVDYAMLGIAHSIH
jgi:hypothetical protein